MKDQNFSEKPPRLKDLVNQHVMGDVWIRDTPFGPVTGKYHSKPARAISL